MDTSVRLTALYKKLLFHVSLTATEIERISNADFANICDRFVKKVSAVEIMQLIQYYL